MACHAADGFLRDRRTSPALAWVLAAFSIVILASGAAAVTISARLTADNAYQLWLGNSTGVTTAVGGAMNCSPDEIFTNTEAYSFDPGSSPYLYLVAYGDNGSLQGLLGHFKLGGKTIHTGDAPWEVFATGIDLHLQCPPPAGPYGPAAAALNAEIVRANANAGAATSSGGWVGTSGGSLGRLAVGEANDSATGLFPVVPNIDPPARWMWFNQGAAGTDAFQGGNQKEYLIFRLPVRALQTCTPPPGGMVAWWPLDETSGIVSRDVVGAHHGKHNGGPAAAPGQVAGGLRFDGIDDYVRVPDHPALDFGGGGDFSLDAWIRPDHVSGTQVIVDKRKPVQTGVESGGYSFYLFGDKLGLQISDATPLGYSNYVSTGSVVAGRWTHVAVTVDRDGAPGLRLYIDGQLSGAFTGTGLDNVDNPSDLILGRRSDGFGGGYYAGILDEVEIFNRNLGAAEVAALFQAGPTGKCKQTVTVSWDRPICRGAATGLAHPILCNHGTRDHRYALSFNGLPTSAYCTIPGPTSFTLRPPDIQPLLIPAGTCRTLAVDIGRPAGGATGGVGCYGITASNLDTGTTSQAMGSVWLNNRFCPTLPTLPGTELSVNTDFTVLFRVANTDGAARTLAYEFEGVSADMNPENRVVALNGLAPGVTVRGQAQIPAGGSADLPVRARLVAPQPFVFQEVLLRDTETNEILSSATLRSGSGGACSADADELCLGNGRFKIAVAWRDFAGRTGSGKPVTLTGDTGYFWFFDPSNVELAIKVLDGRPLNGNFWVFYGALSSVEYTLIVTDTVTGRSKSYTNPSGRLASVGDTDALPAPADAPADPADLFATASVLPSAALTPNEEAGDCVPGPQSLCLNGSRFLVEVSWRDFSGNTGQGKAVALTSDTGYFWFFNDANVELVLKVLDGRPVNGQWWVFYGALSSVEYTITVRDIDTGRTKTYRNPGGTLASQADTTAFPAS